MTLFLHEEEILTTGQGAVGIRLLAACGGFQHVVAHQPEQFVDLDIGRRHPLHQRDGEGTVIALAVERGLAVLGRTASPDRQPI